VSILKDLVGAPLDRGEPRLSECPYEGSVDRALWGGLHADRLGWAFRAGYVSALHRLFAHAGASVPSADVCLAATERGGAHPRAIETTLREDNGVFLLKGEKTFATLASMSDELLIVATRGKSDDGKNQLVMVRVPRDANGLSIEDRPPTAFAPEIPHAIVRLDDVAVASSAVLPGDGYEMWLKPFRTIEDTHVLAATVGYLAGVARAYGFDRNVLAELVAHAAGLTDAGARSPSDPVTHVLLAGLFSSARKLAASLDSEWHHKVTPEERERWLRDMPLLLIAENARTKRTETAFAALSR
jgi:acyl-CoA dehydrogenase